MLVQYKRNKKTLYYNPETLPSVGRPEPFSVCTHSGLPPLGRNRMFARRAWKSTQFEQDEISR